MLPDSCYFQLVSCQINPDCVFQRLFQRELCQGHSEKSLGLEFKAVAAILFKTLVIHSVLCFQGHCQASAAFALLTLCVFEAFACAAATKIKYNSCYCNIYGPTQILLCSALADPS